MSFDDETTVCINFGKAFASRWGLWSEKADQKWADSNPRLSGCYVDRITISVFRDFIGGMFSSCFEAQSNCSRIESCPHALWLTDKGRLPQYKRNRSVLWKHVMLICWYTHSMEYTIQHSEKWSTKMRIIILIRDSRIVLPSDQKLQKWDSQDTLANEGEGK